MLRLEFACAPIARGGIPLCYLRNYHPSVVTLAIVNTTGTVISETRYALERMVRVAPRHIAFGEISVSFEQFLSFAESEYVYEADIRESRTSINGIEAIYYLNRPDMLGSFEAELRSKGLPDNYSVVSEASSFENVAGHLENLQSLTLTFLIIVLILTARQILGVSILLASIAGIISIGRITKCEPIKILMERN